MLALFLCPVLWQTATAVDVPPKHPVYDFLLRMEARGLFESPLPQTMPYTREDVVRRLTLLRGHWEALNGLEKREAGEYLSQLADSTGDDADGNGSGPLAFYRNGHDLAELRGPAWRVAGNPVFEARQEFHRLSADSNGAMSVWASGFEVHGVLRHFGFSVRATDAHVRGDAKLADRTDFPYRYDVRPSGFDYDEADAGISYEVPHAALFFGKARNHWGSGRFESLILSDQPTSYTQFRGRFTLGPVELTALQAKLQQRPPVVVGTDTTAEGIVRRDYAEKFLAAHRLQVNVSRWLQVGIYEAVVYGERSFDLDYVNPMMFLRSAEHYADDRDNALMGFDLKWRPLRDVLLHGDLLIDDVSTTHLGEGFFGNKLGFQGGAEWYDPAGLSNTRLVCEYTRIEPYVYSHKFAINSYQHYGSVLGASTGPNSDVLTASLAWTVSRPVQLEVWTQWRRHGANPASGTNVGGDPRRPWGPGDAQHVHFLDGDKETFRTVGLQGRVEMIHDLYVAASASVTSSDTRFMAGGKRSETRSLGMAELRWNPW
ncbi:MAG TPA: capsule assembly Wzi family protein [bacterium]